MQHRSSSSPQQYTNVLTFQLHGGVWRDTSRILAASLMHRCRIALTLGRRKEKSQSFNGSSALRQHHSCGSVPRFEVSEPGSKQYAGGSIGIQESMKCLQLERRTWYCKKMPNGPGTIYSREASYAHSRIETPLQAGSPIRILYSEPPNIC